MVGKHWSRPWFLVVLLVVLALSACARRRPLEPKSSTWSELREVRPGITVEEPGASARAPFPHERLVDGAEVELAAGALAWLRLDSGATLLLQGPGRFVQRPGGVELNQGRAFLDSPPGPSTELVTPRGTLRLAQVRTSLDVDASGRTEAYVLSGELRAEGDLRVTAGQRAVLAAGAPPKVEPVAVWRDWTGGLATTDQTPAPAPFGVGVVGARLPGEVGAARFPLAIQALRVGATIQGDFAVTEVTETFFNPSSNTVEGVYSLRLPPGATLERFGVDREGRMAWGRVQERQSAAAQYAANVYAGSKEDPALLQWEAPGVYRATLYPIEPGATRRVVLRYTEWLPRSGEHGQRRLYLYPMAAEGAEENLPHLEELTVDLDLRDAHAKEIRSGLSGVREGEHLLIRRQDYVPRADLAVELLDGGEERLVAYRAPHQVDVELLPSNQREAARLAARDERDYLLVPLRGAELPKAKPGVDLSIVVDSSAATSEGALALARAATRALLAHLGANDRVVVWAGADGLRPLLGQPQLATVDAALRDRLSAELARIPRGGATDLGRNLSDALAVLEPERRGAVVYLGDGSPTVGELSQGELLARLDKLPHPAPLFSLGLGEGSDLALLDALSRGGFARRVTDGAGAARAALDVLEAASRGAWMSVAVDLGPGVERVYPRGKGALLVGDSEFVVGRLVADAPPTTMNVTGLGASVQRALTTRTLQDAGDLKRRWAEQRMAELLANREGRASLVDVGMRYGILTPVTSLYVPTKRELAEQYAPMNEAEVATVEQAETADKKEGGTGSRAKGEEGSMGSGASTKAMPFSVRSASQGSAPAAPAPMEQAAAAQPEKARLEAEIEVASAMVARKAPAGRRPSARSGAGAADPSDPLAENDVAPKQDSKPAQDAPGTAQVLGSLGGGGLGLIGTGNGGGGLDLGNAALAVFGGGRGGLPDGAGGAPPQATDRDVTLTVIELPRVALPCSAAAYVPLEERARLWQERLQRNPGSPSFAAEIYREALRACEAPLAADRSKLRGLMLEAVPAVADRVTLWRLLRGELGAGDELYHAIVSRLKDTAELRQLNAALGLQSADPGELDKLSKASLDANERVQGLRKLRSQWPDDFVLALRLLDALEDARDVVAVRQLAAELRARPDVDATVRTAVGELYLRLSQGDAEPGEKASDLQLARQAFGEIVEFAPSDPVARRRLGDLLRAHGWYVEARRQYETLQGLTPDDPTVALLLASVAEGEGRLEEAVRWTERGRSAGAPDADQGPAATARMFASTYLAWGRLTARQQGNQAEFDALSARATRVLGSAVASGQGSLPRLRVTLTWDHPDLHPTLWTDALGAPMPVFGGDMTLGIAEGLLSPTGSFEVRFDADALRAAARLGAVAYLTIVSDELGPKETIVKKAIQASTEQGPVLRFRFENGEVIRG